MDGRCVVVIGQRGKKQGMSNDAGSTLWVEADLLESAFDRFRTIEVGESLIQIQRIGQHEVAITRVFSPDCFIGGEKKGSLQISEDGIIELWIS